MNDRDAAVGGDRIRLRARRAGLGEQQEGGEHGHDRPLATHVLDNLTRQHEQSRWREAGE
jgi:hypothetical protein